MPGQRADPLTIRWRSISIFLEDASGRRLFHGAAGVSDRPRLAWAYPFHEYIPGTAAGLGAPNQMGGPAASPEVVAHRTAKE